MLIANWNSWGLCALGTTEETNWKQRIKARAKDSQEYSKRDETIPDELITSKSNQSRIEPRRIEFNGWARRATDRDRWKSRFSFRTHRAKRCPPHSKLIEMQWHTHYHSNNRRAFCTAWRTWCIDVWWRRRIFVRVENLRWSGVRQMMTSGGHKRKKSAGRIMIEIVVNDFMPFVHGASYTTRHRLLLLLLLHAL